MAKFFVPVRNAHEGTSRDSIRSLDWSDAVFSYASLCALDLRRLGDYRARS